MNLHTTYYIDLRNAWDGDTSKGGLYHKYYKQHKEIHPDNHVAPSTFGKRLKEHGRSLHKAIHTPSKGKKTRCLGIMKDRKKSGLNISYITYWKRRQKDGWSEYKINKFYNKA